MPASKVSPADLKRLVNIQTAEIGRLNELLRAAEQARLDASREITRLQDVGVTLSDGLLAITGAAWASEEPRAHDIASTALVRAGITPNTRMPA